jgi:hypothetical protein
MDFDEGGKSPDCLHICYPGPLDIVGRLFDQLLDNIGARSVNDGEKNFTGTEAVATNRK